MEGSFGLRKGAWTEEEDILLRQCIERFGEGKWHQVPLIAGLNRCRKSCRLRWLNYLKPNLNRGKFTPDEIDLLIRFHKLLGNRWSLIAGRLSGRTANDVKNYWNTRMNKKNEIIGFKEMKEETQNMVKVNKIKPQPYTISKNFIWSSANPTSIADNIQPPRDNLSDPSLTLMPSENSIKWWESFLDGNEGEESAICSTTGGLEGELVTNLWTEKIAPPTKLGDTFAGEGPSCWNDNSFDVDLWDLFNPKLG